MILDKAYCFVYSVIDMPGNASRQILKLKHSSFYSELDFATKPLKTIDQDDAEISMRVRILQNRSVNSRDKVIISNKLKPSNDDIQYDIVRAYHGTDDESGEAITDLSLRNVMDALQIEM